MRAIRALVLIHRYLGIAVGILMVGWCLSGIVMMYVSYPELSPAERLRGLVPLDWKHCCVLPAQSLADNETVAGFSIEELGDEPVLRVRLASGTRLLDLTNGRSIASVPESLAMRVAGQYRLHEASRTPFAGVPSAKAVRFDRLIDHDPWTVSGSFDSDRPLYRFALRDAAQTVLYVSARTGEAVQVTTAHERFWNWLGAIPHWLYFSELRRNTALWSQVVIWTSLIGSVL